MKLKEALSQEELEKAKTWWEKNTHSGRQIQFYIHDGRLVRTGGHKEIALKHNVTSVPYDLEINGGEFSVLDSPISSFDSFKMPTGMTVLRIEECPNLHDLKGCENISQGKNVSPPDVYLESVGVTSLQGLPEKVERFSLFKCERLRSFGGSTVNEVRSMDLSYMSSLRSLEGMPQIFNGPLTIAETPLLKSLKGIKNVKGIEFIKLGEATDISSNILGLLKLGIDYSDVRLHHSYNKTKMKKAMEILKEFWDSREVVDAQSALIDAGLDEFASF